MKTEEDEAFDEIARKQGGGFMAKRAMAADKFIAAEERKVNERYGYVPKLHPSEWMGEPAQEPMFTYDQVKAHIQAAMMSSPLPVQREWIELTDEETSGFTSQEMTVVKYVSKVLQEKNGD